MAGKTGTAEVARQGPTLAVRRRSHRPTRPRYVAAAILAESRHRRRGGRAADRGASSNRSPTSAAAAPAADGAERRFDVDPSVEAASARAEATTDATDGHTSPRPRACRPVGPMADLRLTRRALAPPRPRARRRRRRHRRLGLLMVYSATRGHRPQPYDTSYVKKQSCSWCSASTAHGRRRDGRLPQAARLRPFVYVGVVGLLVARAARRSAPSRTAPRLVPARAVPAAAVRVREARR